MSIYAVGSLDDSCVVINNTAPTAPVLSGQVHGAGAPNWLDGAIALKVRGSYAYVACITQDSLTIVDISNPAAPATVGHITGAGAPNYLNGAVDVFVHGNYAYVVCNQDDSLTIIDITNPTNPTFKGHIAGAGGPNFLQGANGVWVEGDYAYTVANQDSAFSIFNISNPSNPYHVASLNGAGAPFYFGWVQGIWKKGNYIFLCASNDDCLTVVDVSNPAAPARVAHVGSAAAPWYMNNPINLWVEGDYAYVVSSTADALTIIDISDPTNPTFVGELHGAFWLDGAYTVYIEGDYAYIACEQGDYVAVVDISNPAAPTRVATFGGAGAPNYLNGATGVSPLFSMAISLLPASVSSAAVVLTASLTDDAWEDCSVRFEYGLTAALGINTPWRSGKVAGDTIGETLTGLPNNTTYYYRAAVKSAAGTVYSATATFTTPTGPPSIETLAATNITPISARLNALVTRDNGLGCQVKFEWGSTPAYGMVTDWILGGFLAGDTAYVDIDNIASGAVFHFRAVIRDKYGTSYGADATFSTPTYRGEMSGIDTLLALVLEEA